MKYFILGIDGVHSVILLTRTAYTTLESAKKYAASVAKELHPFIVQEIEEFCFD